jgi:hypothetical protein
LKNTPRSSLNYILSQVEPQRYAEPFKRREKTRRKDVDSGPHLENPDHSNARKSKLPNDVTRFGCALLVTIASGLDFHRLGAGGALGPVLPVPLPGTDAPWSWPGPRVGPRGGAGGGVGGDGGLCVAIKLPFCAIKSAKIEVEIDIPPTFFEKCSLTPVFIKNPKHGSAQSRLSKSALCPVFAAEVNLTPLSLRLVVVTKCTLTPVFGEAQMRAH